MDRAQLRAALLAALALLIAGVLAAPARAALSAETMFEPTTVVAIDLRLPPSSVEALEDDPDEYVEGTFALAESDGTPSGIGAYSDPLTVGIRLKGGTGSFRGLDGKAAFKVKFNEFVGGQKFLGLKKLTLNNMVQDASMLHEALAYPAFRAAGIPAPHAGYAYVYVNGVDYGLHLNLETLDDVALKKWFGGFGDPQHLYEGGPRFELAPENLGSFELDEGDDEARDDLEALIAAANATAPGFSERLAPVADLAEMTRYWAAERYLGHWDGYSGLNVNNYYLLSNPAGVFQMLPWGTDQTLSNGRYPFTGKGGLLFTQCLADPACLATYRQDLVAVEQATTGLDLGARAQALAAQLGPWQARELAQSERAPQSAATIAAEVGKVLEFVRQRPGVLTGWLTKGELPDPEEGDEDEGNEKGPARDDNREPPTPPSPPPTISGRLDLDRSKLGRGLVVVRAAVSGPGTVSLLGTTGATTGPRRGCAVAAKAVRAGTAVLHCRLSAATRARLARRPLGLRLSVVYRPADGTPLGVTRLVRLPRQALEF